MYLPPCLPSRKHPLFKQGKLMGPQFQWCWLCIDGQHSERHKQQESCSQACHSECGEAVHDGIQVSRASFMEGVLGMVGVEQHL